MTPSSKSFDVRVWAIRKYRGKNRTTHSVRWTVGEREWHKTFPTLKLAEGHRSMLISASNSGEHFDIATGLPVSMSSTPTTSWLDHSMKFVRMKWPDAAPKYRKSLAESLTVVTTSLLPERKPSTPPITALREALYNWAFTAPEPKATPPPQFEEAIAWLKANGPSIEDLEDLALVRSTLEKMALTLDGRRASNSTVAKRRSALHNCLEYAVERGVLAKNPLEGVKRKRLPPAPAIDRRRVANPTQAKALISAVRETSPSLEAYFATLYYAGTRPAEALNLRESDCKLPRSGWGELVLASSYQRPGPAWTDEGQASEERQLKHRSEQDIRIVPAHPSMVAILRSHIDQFVLGPDGRLFVGRTGRAGRPKPPPYEDPVSANTIYRAWHRARLSALSEAEQASMLAARPYDLRHACLSTWLNAGVAPTQVAEWAGHSVAVLLSVYAKCLDGQDQIAFTRIEGAIDTDAE